MTTRYLETYLIGRKGIRNIGKDSYAVLHALLDADSMETLESDANFTAKIVAFANQEVNIWAKENGEYLLTDAETESIRAVKLEQIAQKLEMDVAKVDSLITRIYTALIRHMRRNVDFTGAIENSREKIEAAVQEFEAES